MNTRKSSRVGLAVTHMHDSLSLNLPSWGRQRSIARLKWPALAAILFASLTSSAPADIHYLLQPVPSERTFVVHIDLKADSGATTFRIPAWSPGYYHLENFQDQITAVAAKDGSGSALPITKVDDRGWKVTSKPGETIDFSYRVLGSDAALGFFGSMLNSRVGFVNGASTFMYVDKRLTEPDVLTVKSPTGWDLVTSLDKDDSGAFVATSGYDEFIDCPIQIGTFHREKFNVEGIPFEAIFVTSGPKLACDPKVEAERLRLVSAPAIEMFHGAGFKHYTYILHLDPGNFQGGLEHRASTCIDVPNDAHLNLDDLAGHENFHAWNVKQIRPFVLGPFDYTGPDRTANLWWMEGVTDYYSKIVTYRSSLQDSNWLLGQISEQISELQNSTQRLKTTLEDCSRGCWENGGFGVGDLSFYTKGFLVGLIFDAEIRDLTHGEKSLDDVIRLLFERYRLPQPGLPEDGIQKAIAEVVGSGTLDSLYDRMLRSTQELPYDELRKLGLQLEVPGRPYTRPSYTASKGIVVQASGPALDAGLKAGDKLLSISDIAVGPDGQLPANQQFVVEREGAKVTLTIPVITAFADHLELILDPAAGSEALKNRAAWLKRKS